MNHKKEERKETNRLQYSMTNMKILMQNNSSEIKKNNLNNHEI